MAGQQCVDKKLHFILHIRGTVCLHLSCPLYSTGLWNAATFMAHFIFVLDAFEHFICTVILLLHCDVNIVLTVQSFLKLAVVTQCPLLRCMYYARNVYMCAVNPLYYFYTVNNCCYFYTWLMRKIIYHMNSNHCPEHSNKPLISIHKEV